MFVAALAGALAVCLGLAPPDDAPPTYPDYERTTIEGFTVLVERDLRSTMLGRRALAALRQDLREVNRVVPAAALGVVRSVPVWVTRKLPARLGWPAAGLAYHESREWVTRAGYGPERAGAIEVCNAENYLLWRAEQPYSVLHELSHAYHLRVVGVHDRVRAAYEAAKAGGRYETVEHALADEARRAYAMNNEKEYFAELSEAWFGLNDYGPRTREELEAFDPRGAELMREVWSLSAAEIAANRKDP